MQQEILRNFLLHKKTFASGILFQFLIRRFSFFLFFLFFRSVIPIELLKSKTFKDHIISIASVI